MRNAIGKITMFAAFALTLAVASWAAPGDVTTVAGTGNFGFGCSDGSALSSDIYSFRLAVDSSDRLILADIGCNMIRRVDLSTGAIQTIGGDGSESPYDGYPALSTGMGMPFGVVLDGGNNIFTTLGVQQVARIDAVTTILNFIAGNGGSYYTGDGGPALNAETGYSTEVALDPAGNVYIVQDGYNVVRRIDKTTGIIDRYAGSLSWGAPLGDGGPALDAGLNGIRGLAFDAAGNLHLTDNGNYRVRKVNKTTGIITTVVGNGSSGTGGLGGPATAAELYSPESIAFDSAGHLYIVDNDRILKVDASTHVITQFASLPSYGAGLAIDSENNLYTSDVLRVYRVEGVPVGPPPPPPTDVPTLGEWAMIGLVAALAAIGFAMLSRRKKEAFA